MIYEILLKLFVTFFFTKFVNIKNYFLLNISMYIKKKYSQISNYINGRLFLIILISVIMSSCFTSKNTSFLKDLTVDTIIRNIIVDHSETKICKSDLLSINVSSLNGEMDLGINNSSKSISGNGVSDFAVNGFLINDKGEINIHYLGFVYVEGLTLKELTKKLERDLIPYLREPIVSIHFLNKKVTVIGQVATPRLMSINNDPISVFDVIASCGNLKDDADTKDVIIIRDSGSSKIVKHVNLQNHTFLSSPWFYVKSNDVVYFKKDTNKFDKDIRKREVQTVVSLATSIFSLGILVLNLINK